MSKKEPRLMYDKFCFDATSLFEIWTPEWSSAITSRFQQGFFFFSWQNGALSSWITSPKMSGYRENFPRGLAQVRDYDTFLIY